MKSLINSGLAKVPMELDVWKIKSFQELDAVGVVRPVTRSCSGDT